MINPFLASFELNVLNKKTIKVEVTKVNSGVVEVEQTTTSTKPIETQEFTKVYKMARHVGLIKELNPAGCRMMLYIQAKLKLDHDYIELKREKVAKQLDVSANTVSLGIVNLTECGILAKKSQSEWWINPEVLFVGNRFRYVKANNPKSIKYIEDYNPTIVKLGEVDLTDRILL